MKGNFILPDNLPLILGQLAAQTINNPTSDLITQSEAARILSERRGHPISRQRVSKLVQEGRLLTYSIGGFKFLSKKDVLGLKLRGYSRGVNLRVEAHADTP